MMSAWLWVFAGLSVPMAAYACYLGWHALQFRRGRRLAKPDTEWRPRVAVIIPARNEAATIGKCLRSVLYQDYPSPLLDIVMVDDQSHDGTRNVVEGISRQHPGRIQYVKLPFDPQSIAHKKRALALGMEQAPDAEVIFTLDADCWAEPGWVVAMLAQMQPGTAAVAGPIRKATRRSTTFENLQAVESAGMVALAAGAITAGAPTMANGGNLAFRRSAFEAVGGYKGIDHVASGDDELLLHRMHRLLSGKKGFAEKSIACALHPDAIVETQALRIWAELRVQRIRWVSKAGAYRNWSMTLAQVNTYLAMVCWLATLLLIPFESFWGGIAFGTQTLLKVLADTAILAPALSFLGQGRYLYYAVIGQPIHAAYVLWVGIAGTFSKGYEWKGRKVR